MMIGNILKHITIRSLTLIFFKVDPPVNPSTTSADFTGTSSSSSSSVPTFLLLHCLPLHPIPVAPS